MTYCEPEVASVGLTQAEAEAKYGANKITAYEYNLGGNGKSQILATAGFVKLVQLNDGPVIGIHMVGSRMGEQIGEAQLIYNWEATAADVAALVHAHPTQSGRSARRTWRSPGNRCTRTRDVHLLTAGPGRQDEGKKARGRNRVDTGQDAAVGRKCDGRNRHPMAEGCGRPGRGRRTAVGGVHRQGGHRDPGSRLGIPGRSTPPRTTSSRSAACWPPSVNPLMRRLPLLPPNRGPGTAGGSRSSRPAAPAASHALPRRIR